MIGVVPNCKERRKEMLIVDEEKKDFLKVRNQAAGRTFPRRQMQIMVCPIMTFKIQS